MSDAAHVYTYVGREFHTHGAVKHDLGEYVRGVDHSNCAENFFSIFKRGYVGTYHHMSEAHLHRYTAEFDFRYNHRKVSDAECAAATLKGMERKRLTYRRTNALYA
jgi:hypothetical protein